MYVGIVCTATLKEKECEQKWNNNSALKKIKSEKMILITSRSQDPPLCALSANSPTWWMMMHPQRDGSQVHFRMLDPPPSSHLHRTELFRSQMRRVCASKLPWHDKRQPYRTHTSHTSSLSCNFSATELLLREKKTFGLSCVEILCCELWCPPHILQIFVTFGKKKTKLYH